MLCVEIIDVLIIVWKVNDDLKVFDIVIELF